MKITFVVATDDNRIHLVQHDTSLVERPPFAKKTQINVEREWSRYIKARPDVLTRLGGDAPYDEPSLLGALDGAVTWFEGLDKEPWEREMDDLEIGV